MLSKIFIIGFLLVNILLYLSSLAVYMVQMWLSMPCSGQMPTEGRPGSTCAMERECSHIVAAWEKGARAVIMQSVGVNG